MTSYTPQSRTPWPKKLFVLSKFKHSRLAIKRVLTLKVVQSVKTAKASKLFYHFSPFCYHFVNICLRVGWGGIVCVVKVSRVQTYYMYHVSDNNIQFCSQICVICTFLSVGTPFFTPGSFICAAGDHGISSWLY